MRVKTKRKENSCVKCGGRGWMYWLNDDKPKIECNDCKGTGKKK